jgi:hypothetical protein
MFAPVENPEYGWSPLKFVAALILAGAIGALFFTPHHKVADFLLILSMLLLLVDIYRKRSLARSVR